MAEREYTALWNGGPVFAPGDFRISTDSVLLADFAAPRNESACMDLGCGSGLLCVLLGAASEKMRLRGIEINPKWAEDCRENLARNDMLSRSEILTGDIRRHRELFRAGSFSLVVSNPPYFPEKSGADAADPELALARGEGSLTLSELCAAAAFLCKNGGRFCLVHRADRLSNVLCELAAAKLEPKRLRLVQHRLDSPPSIALIEARRSGRPGLSVLPTLILKNADGTDTPEARRIYKLDISQKSAE